tara:strand:+ start:1267 stop:1443 length:177 start_codon:yes stop_codon:yes gene_type:complete
MYNERPSTKLLRMVISIRDSLDQIEHGKTSSFHEIKRLEQLDKVFTATLFHSLIDEVV